MHPEQQTRNPQPNQSEAPQNQSRSEPRTELVCLTRHQRHPKLRWERLTRAQWQGFLDTRPHMVCTWKIPEGDPSDPRNELKKTLNDHPKGPTEKFAVILEDQQTRTKTIFVSESSNKGEASDLAKLQYPQLRPRGCLHLAEMAYAVQSLETLFGMRNKKTHGPQRNNRNKNNGQHKNPQVHNTETHFSNQARHNWKGEGELIQTEQQDELDVREFLIGCLPEEQTLPESTIGTPAVKLNGKIIALITQSQIIHDGTIDGEEAGEHLAYQFSQRSRC